MAAFNVNLGNKMVMKTAAMGRTGNRLQFEDDDKACGCLWKNKRSKHKSQKERIKQFSIWFEEVDTARQRVFAQRRFDRQYQREQRRRKVQCFRRMFIPTGILWLTGFYMTLASTVRGLGEGSIFWTKREMFHIIGPVTLGFGFIMLMITEGLISYHQLKMKTLESRGVEIDVDNQKGQTLKAISGKIPSLRMENEIDDEYAESEPFVAAASKPVEKPKISSFKQTTKHEHGTIDKAVQTLFNAQLLGEPQDATSRGATTEHVTP